MLKLEISINDSLWPKLTIVINRESYAAGRIVQTVKIPYDLAYGKAEEMVHNQLRPMVEELVKRHRRNESTGVQQTQP